MNKHEILSQILFRREAEEVAGLSRQAFQHHIDKRHIVPAKEHGTGKGKAQLFWREDVEDFKKGKYKEEIKVNGLKEAIKGAISKGAYVMVFKDGDRYCAEFVAENGKDSFKRYNEVVAEFDFTDRIITDGVKTIQDDHPDYEANLDAEAEYQVDEIDVEEEIKNYSN